MMPTTPTAEKTGRGEQKAKINFFVRSRSCRRRRCPTESGQMEVRWKKLINGVLQNGGRCTAATQDFEKYTFVKNTFKKYTAEEKNTNGLFFRFSEFNSLTLQQFVVTAINPYHISHMTSIKLAPRRKVFEGPTKLKGFHGKRFDLLASDWIKSLFEKVQTLLTLCNERYGIWPTASRWKHFRSF